MKFWFISSIILSFIGYNIIYLHVNKEFKSKERLRKILSKKWNDARSDRLAWKENNKYSFDFFDSEYQALWYIEIGAEDLYLMYNSVAQNISWVEYNDEQREFENKQF